MKHSEKAMPQNLKWVENLAALMDDSFKIPFTNIRFGLDPIIGLIPGFGEAASFSISSLLILAMVKHGVSGSLAIKMVGNVLVDTIIGSIPFFGDIFDFAKKANRKNIQLLKEHHEEGKHSGSGIGLMIGIGLLLLAIGVGVVFLLWKIFSNSWELLFG